MTAQLFWQDPPPRRPDVSSDVQIAEWEAWLGRVSYMTGIANLDGDLKSDGYSIDWLYDLYLDNADPKTAACAVIVGIATARHR